MPHSVGILWKSDQPDAETLPGHTQHSQETDIHAPGGIRTHNPNKPAAANPRLGWRDHRNQRLYTMHCWILAMYAPKDGVSKTYKTCSLQTERLRLMHHIPSILVHLHICFYSCVLSVSRYVMQSKYLIILCRNVIAWAIRTAFFAFPQMPFLRDKILWQYVVILCVFVVLCVHCFIWHFRCRTAG